MTRAVRQNRTFDEVAELYDRARPGYPDDLIRDVIEASDLGASSRILEVGCGTGQATRPFAAEGLSVTCLEPGENLARLAARNLAPYPNARVVVATFESFELNAEPFDLLISAQAFHWVAQEVRVSKAAQALRGAGWLAVFWNQPLRDPSEARRAVEEAYVRLAPRFAARLPATGASARETSLRDEVEASGCFGTPMERAYPWETTYSARRYVELMQTQSDHRLLPPAQLAALAEAVHEAIERHGGSIRVPYLARLCLAQRDR